MHGRTEIFEGLKMTLRTKLWEEKYTTLISIKNTTNFVLTTFLYNDFFTVLLIAVKLNFGDALHAQDNLSKLLTALSAIAAPSDRRHPSNFVQIFGKGAGAKGGDGGERGEQLW